MAPGIKTGILQCCLIYLGFIIGFSYQHLALQNSINVRDGAYRQGFNDFNFSADPTRKSSDEQLLLFYLMTNYELSVRPVQNASSVVNIDLGITLNQIFDVDERNQVLVTHIWLDQEWTDEKLKWDPLKFNGILKIRIPCQRIWLPDIVLYNSADDYTTGYMPALAMVSSDGRVFWPPIVKLRSTCKIDITYFPFDDQVCKLKFGSWAYDGTQVDVWNRSSGVDLKNYVSNGEWALIDVKVVRNYVIYSCCPEPYPDITFTLHMRRRTLYYTYNVIVPCVMLSMLTLLGFWMPPDSGEKVTLGLTVLLAFSVFMLLIAENMPATSFYVPLIGVYLTVVMMLTSMSVAMAVSVSNVHHQGDIDHDVPAWLRKTIGRIAQFLCMRSYMRDTRNISPSLATVSTPLKESFNGINVNFVNDNSELNLIELETCSYDGNGRKVYNRGSKRRTMRYTDSEEIIRKLSMIIARQEEQAVAVNTNRGWQEVARVVDRCLFVFHLISVFTSTVTILVLVPLSKSVSIRGYHDS